MIPRFEVQLNLKPKPKKPPNWLKIRAEYEAGDITLNKLAQKYKVPLRTLMRRSSNESWATLRQETGTKVASIVQDHVAQKIAAVTISELDMLVTVRDSVYNELISTEKPLTFKSKEGAIKALIELNQALKESDAKKPEKVTGIIYELVHTRKKDVI